MKLRLAIAVLLLLAAFLATYCTYVPAAASFQQQLGPALAAGEGPDVTYVDLHSLDQINDGLLQPLPTEAAGPLALQDFQPVLLDFFRRDEKLYALPHDVQPVALLVNPELFQKYDLPYPGTWNELVEIAYALQERERAAGNEDFAALGLTAGFWNWLPFLFQAGGAVWNAEGDALALDSPEAERALGFYQELVQAHRIARVVTGEWPDRGAYVGEGSVLNLFAQRKVGMCLGGPGMYGILKNWKDGPPVEAIELPEGPGGHRGTIAVVRGLGITARSKQMGAGLDLLAYATGPQGMRFWIGDPSTPPDYIPARTSLQGLWVEVHPDTHAFVKAIEYVRPYLPVRVPVRVAAAAEFDRLASEQIEAVLRGQPVEETLRLLQEQGTALLRGS